MQDTLFYDSPLHFPFKPITLSYAPLLLSAWSAAEIHVTHLILIIHQLLQHVPAAQALPKSGYTDESSSSCWGVLTLCGCKLCRLSALGCLKTFFFAQAKWP